VAATVKVAEAPAVTATSAGCCAMLSVTGTVTVRVAAGVVALPAELLTTTTNVAPVSPATVAGVV
jgi:hypothetical protein